MKPKSISGIVYYVSDVMKTASFYRQLGFQAGKNEAGAMTVYLNWFWIEFRKQEQDNNTSKSAQKVYISVDDIKQAYQDTLAKEVGKISEPQELQGRQEFTLEDPDGFQLVFFQKAGS